MLKSIDKILAILKSNPEAYITYSRISAKAELVNGADNKSSINFDTFLKVRPSLTQLPYDGHSRDRYNYQEAK